MTDLKARAVTIGTAVLLLTFLSMPPARAFSANPGWSFDLFTQKVPFDGVGPGVPSDAFEPMESIMLFASIMFNDFPRSNIIVLFNVSSPANLFQNISYIYTGITNESGIAQAPVFRIPNISDALFGTWSVTASADTGDNVIIYDTLTFDFGWIVNFVSLTVLGENATAQTEFPRGGNLGIDIALRNIAMTDMATTLSIVAFDSLSYFIDSVKINVTVPANGSIAHYLLSLFLPKNATVGQATLYANAYKSTFDSGGIPYCPQFPSSFTVGSVNIAVVGVAPSTSEATKDQVVYIDVTVQNMGSSNQTFEVDLTLNGTIYSTLGVADLPVGSKRIVTFGWNASSEGIYLVAANATIMPYDEDPSNNNYVDGYINVKTFIPPGEPFLPEWFNWLIIGSAVALAILIGVLLLARRRNTNNQQTLYTGWTASYYNYIFRDGHPEKKRSGKSSRHLSRNS